MSYQKQEILQQMMILLMNHHLHGNMTLSMMERLLRPMIRGLDVCTIKYIFHLSWIDINERQSRYSSPSGACPHGVWSATSEDVHRMWRMLAQFAPVHDFYDSQFCLFTAIVEGFSWKSYLRFQHVDQDQRKKITQWCGSRHQSLRSRLPEDVIQLVMSFVCSVPYQVYAKELQ